MSMDFKTLDTVVLLHDLPAHGLRAGDLGAVVETYEPDGREVEFVTASGRTGALVTLKVGDVILVFNIALFLAGAYFALRAYEQVIKPAALLPEEKAHAAVLLHTHLLEKAVYELGYELNNRPDWIQIPLQGIMQLIQPAEK